MPVIPNAKTLSNKNAKVVAKKPGQYRGPGKKSHAVKHKTGKVRAWTGK